MGKKTNVSSSPLSGPGGPPPPRTRGPREIRGSRGVGRGRDKQVGFVTMGTAAAGARIPDIGVGMLGYAFMGKAHSNAYKTIAYMTWPPPLMPRLRTICGRNEKA